MMPPHTVQSVRPALSITTTAPGGDVVEEVADRAAAGVDRLVGDREGRTDRALALPQRADAVQ